MHSHSASPTNSIWGFDQRPLDRVLCPHPLAHHSLFMLLPCQLQFCRAPRTESTITMLTRLLLLALLLVCNAGAAAYSAFSDGESFRYRVSWGMFPNAGEIHVSAQRETFKDRPVFRIRMVTSTKGMVRRLYSYEDTAEALIDIETGKLISATERVDKGDQSINSTTQFDYGSRLAIHRDQARPGRNVDIPIPEGTPTDLLSALIGARHWGVSPGEKRSALIFAGRDIYPVNIYADRYERIDYQKKQIDALLLLPKMEDQPPRGIFRRGGEIRVWLAKDGEKLPVRMQLKLNFGTAHLALIEHKVALTTAAR